MRFCSLSFGLRCGIGYGLQIERLYAFAQSLLGVFCLRDAAVSVVRLAAESADELRCFPPRGEFRHERRHLPIIGEFLFDERKRVI